MRVSNRSVAGGRGTRSVRADREPGATDFGSRDGPFRPGREFGEEHQTSPRHCQRFRDRKSLVPSRLSTRGRDMLMQPDDGCGKRRRSPPTFARIVGVHGMGRAISQKSKFGGKIFWEAGNGPNAGRGLGHAWAGGSKANGHEARGHPLSVKPKADTQGISVERVTPRVASRRSVLSWLALVHEARNCALVATLEVGEMNARSRSRCPGGRLWLVLVSRASSAGMDRKRREGHLRGQPVAGLFAIVSSTCRRERGVVCRIALPGVSANTGAVDSFRPVDQHFQDRVVRHPRCSLRSTQWAASFSRAGPDARRRFCQSL